MNARSLCMGALGLQITTASPPDGYTFMMTSTAYGFLIDKPKVEG